jgi:hypothetical protein
MNNSTPAAPSTPAPTAPPPSTAPSTMEPQAEISPAQAATMAEWAKQDLANGKITAEQAEKIFTDLNTPLEQRAPDSRSDEEKLLDTQFPTAQPRDYTIRYGRPGEDVKETPELKAFDQNARGWLSAAGMPKNIGDSLVNAIAKTAQATQRMSASELETYGAREFEKLQKAHGPALEEKLNAAGRMVEALEAKQPGLKNLLKSNGIGDSAMVANMLIAHAQIYHERKR